MKASTRTVLTVLLGTWAGTVCASGLDEFKVKREANFAFEGKPVVTRSGDRVTIRFETKAFCDATVAIETEGGRVVRHLACGVLGVNAPPPFAKNAKVQTLVWDGKDDAGKYLDDKDSHAVRVSLGLAPMFERNLFWDPRKRFSHAPALVQATEEGVYVFEGAGVDTLKLFDHEGNYLRTIYPFPADKLDQVKGLVWHVAPQDGLKAPLKEGSTECTLLTSGTSAMPRINEQASGSAAAGMAVHKGRVALADWRLNRLATDGSTGGLNLKGPKTGIAFRLGDSVFYVGPAGLAFSPDARRLYLTGYLWNCWELGKIGHSLPVVLKMDYDGDAEPQVFAGDRDENNHGTDNAHFRVPAAVACDEAGRVYVADYMNDRIQVFDAEGKYLKSIPARRPAKLTIHRKTREIYVFSWTQWGITNLMVNPGSNPHDPVKPTLTRLGPFENPAVRASWTLGFPERFLGPNPAIGRSLDAEVDTWTDPPTVWISMYKRDLTAGNAFVSGYEAIAQENADDAWVAGSLLLLSEKDGKLAVKRSFGTEVRENIARAKPPTYWRQRLYVNPKNGRLYLGEGVGADKSFAELVELDPESGKARLVGMPFDAEDICFDSAGLVYLRTDTEVARYDAETWREVPWDYGEERERVGFGRAMFGKQSSVISALPLPGKRAVYWDEGGMWVSSKGNLAVACANGGQIPPRPDRGEFEDARKKIAGRPYMPPNYPGRFRWQEIHVWDKHGKMVYEDAIPGIDITNGLALDQDDNLYVLASANRVLDGSPYFNVAAGTLIKFRPKQGKILSTSGHVEIPLAKDALPAGPPQIVGFGGKMWVQGAEWFYGGVGIDGFNWPNGCRCFIECRSTLDYFARSFAPEVDHYSVAVLDTNGNLILRVGRYGNVDSSGPKSLVPLGGDEVGLFHPLYLATHTDRRLFIADAGNQRIVSVRLKYDTSERMLLRDVPDRSNEK